jgi:hypothetical protein
MEAPLAGISVLCIDVGKNVNVEECWAYNSCSVNSYWTSECMNAVTGSQSPNSSRQRVQISKSHVYTCNPSTQEAEAEGLQFRGQPGLHSKTLSQQKKQATS